MMIQMRTTLTLPDDVYAVAKSLAVRQGVSIGEAVAELARRGMNSEAPIDTSKVFPCFVLGPEVPALTLEQTLAAEDEL
jgi:hypothetical protein